MTDPTRTLGGAAAPNHHGQSLLVIGSGAEGAHDPLGQVIVRLRARGETVYGFDIEAAQESCLDGSPQDVLEWFEAALSPDRILVVDLPDLTLTGRQTVPDHVSLEQALTLLEPSPPATRLPAEPGALILSDRNPRVSLLVTMHNQERFVDEAITSCLDQDYEDYEVVVVDDGSTDGTLAALEKYAGSPLLRVVQQPNVGRTGRIDLVDNRLWWESKGDLLAYLGGDDVCEPSRLSAQVEAFDEDPKLGVCHSAASRIGDSGEPLGDIFHLSASYDDLSFRRILTLGNVVGAPSAMIRRTLLDSLNGYEDGLASDYQLWLRASLIGRFRFLPRRLVRYRTHEESLSTSSSGRGRAHADGVRSRSRLLRRTELRDLWPELPSGSRFWGDAAIALGNAVLDDDPGLAQHFYEMATSDPRARENAALAQRLEASSIAPGSERPVPRLPSAEFGSALETARADLPTTAWWDGTTLETATAYIGLTTAKPQALRLLLKRWVTRTRPESPLRLALCTTTSSAADVLARVVEASDGLDLDCAANITVESVDSLSLVPPPLYGLKGELTDEADVRAVDHWLATTRPERALRPAGR